MPSPAAAVEETERKGRSPVMSESGKADLVGKPLTGGQLAVCSGSVEKLSTGLRRDNDAVYW